MRLVDVRLVRDGDRVALVGRMEPAGGPATRNYGPDRRNFLQQNLDQARRTGDPELVRALGARARTLDRQVGLRLVLRSLSLGAAALDARAAFLRRWRALRSRRRRG